MKTSISSFVFGTSSTSIFWNNPISKNKILKMKDLWSKTFFIKALTQLFISKHYNEQWICFGNHQYIFFPNEKYFPFCPSVHLSVCPSVCLSVCMLSVCPSVLRCPTFEPNLAAAGLLCLPGLGQVQCLQIFWEK